MGNYTELKQYLTKELQKLKFLKDGVDFIEQLEGAEQTLKELGDQTTQARKDKDAATEELNGVQSQVTEAQTALTKAQGDAKTVIDEAKQQAADIVKKANEDAEQLINDTTNELKDAKAERDQAITDKDALLLDITALTKQRDGLLSDIADIKKKLG